MNCPISNPLIGLFCIYMASGITFKGLDEFQKKLESLRTDNPEFEKRLRGVIRKILGEVRSRLSKDAKNGLQMKSDPRHAYKAVRYAVYKKIFGGQTNILPSRKAGAQTKYQPTRKGISGRGGNRMGVSPRTEQLNSYEGKDRGFILRFLNAGTVNRTIGFTKSEARARVNRGSQGGDISKYGKTINTGKRGAISSRNWFGPRSQAELRNAAGRIQELIDKVINDEFV